MDPQKETFTAQFISTPTFHKSGWVKSANTKLMKHKLVISARLVMHTEYAANHTGFYNSLVNQWWMTMMVDLFNAWP